MTPPGRPPAASQLTLSQIMDQHHTNLMGTVHGGRILNLIDSAAGVVAARHSDGPAVTAAMDETVFLRAVRVGDVVHLDARITWAGRSSMEVAVRVTADRWDRAVPPTTVVTSHLVMVAVDEADILGGCRRCCRRPRKTAGRSGRPRSGAGTAFPSATLSRARYRRRPPPDAPRADGEGRIRHGSGPREVTRAAQGAPTSALDGARDGDHGLPRATTYRSCSSAGNGCRSMIRPLRSETIAFLP